MKMKQINTHIHTHEKHKRCKTIDNIHVFCWSGQFLEADYTLEQDDPVDKEASYWYCVPKQCYKPKARCKRNIKHCCFVFLSIFFFSIYFIFCIFKEIATTFTLIANAALAFFFLQ